MNKLFTLIFILTLGTVFGQDAFKLGHNNTAERAAFQADLFPFYQGVASGDPLEDGFVIWTKISSSDASVDVNWRVATDTGFVNIVQSGTVTTSAAKDYTVKEVITGLNPGSTYYYSFDNNGFYSLVGRAKTTPTGATVSQLKFGVVSCSNYQAGYFNAYARLAEYNDLDAVIHLGDYIYEYEEGGYGFDPDIGRGHDPDNEIVTLADYRTRYAFYRLDPDLIRLHQQHTFISVWDDHESANDAYKDGAENHDPATEGDWEDRKTASKDAYFEWMPIRDYPGQKIYRTIQYGDLMDLIMLDTRLEGRTIQPGSKSDPDYNDPSRTLLGATQLAWLKNELSTSTAKWKVVGQQVIFAQLFFDSITFFPGIEDFFLDIWDGYPAEREDLWNFFETNALDNLVMLTGDFHTALGFDITREAQNTSVYNPADGTGSLGVEFCVPSITSANFDENVGDGLTGVIEGVFPTDNPQSKYANFRDHGYMILDITDGKAQGDWYFVDTYTTPSANQSFDEAWFTNDTENYLQQSATASVPKPTQDDPTPVLPPFYTSIDVPTSNILVMNAYPNPFMTKNILSYAVNESERITINLIDMNGRLVKKLVDSQHNAGNYIYMLEANDLPVGTYFYQFQTDNELFVKKVVKL